MKVNTEHGCHRTRIDGVIYTTETNFRIQTAILRDDEGVGNGAESTTGNFVLVERITECDIITTEEGSVLQEAVGDTILSVTDDGVTCLVIDRHVIAIYVIGIKYIHRKVLVVTVTCEVTGCYVLQTSSDYVVEDVVTDSCTEGDTEVEVIELELGLEAMVTGATGLCLKTLSCSSIAPSWFWSMMYQYCEPLSR